MKALRETLCCCFGCNGEGGSGGATNKDGQDDYYFDPTEGDYRSGTTDDLTTDDGTGSDGTYGRSERTKDKSSDDDVSKASLESSVGVDSLFVPLML